MGFLNSWLGNSVVKVLSHSLGPDFEEDEKKAELPAPNSLLDPPYSHLSEQEKMETFEKWMSKYNKSYKNDRQKMKRFAIFKESMEDVEALCSKRKNCCYGLTAFSDLSAAEFSRREGSA